ncbi:craniofacial development protein 2-like [Orbicella faveolata]|uniref:craniofacial development protein 2-like n=1 Tax=Orbicella faveolata TaxID=48498 RepID=UPI0009E56410|nr:craniofacial development protein 2-like [Orbicella faveolata]
MTEVNQTLQGVDTPAVDSLKPKVKTRIACWNVRTLYQTGKFAQVVREFHNYGLDILGVCETRWTESGQRTLASGHTILYSGRLNGHHTEGVALIMSRKMERTLIEWKPLGSRLLKARFNSKYTKLTVIVCYAPIEDAEEADKDAFYDQLQAVTDEVPTPDLLMVLGDLNARPGNNNIGRDRVMGKHGIGTINDNGERLCHFCDKNNMVIGGTLFQHRDIHKTTWTSPSEATKSQIDHILINGKWRDLQRSRCRQ